MALRHFNIRILKTVAQEKKEQWCDKVTMYPRERRERERDQQLGHDHEREMKESPKMMHSTRQQQHCRVDQPKRKKKTYINPSKKKCMEFMYFPLIWIRKKRKKLRQEKLIAHPSQGMRQQLNVQNSCLKRSKLLVEEKERKTTAGTTRLKHATNHIKKHHQVKGQLYPCQSQREASPMHTHTTHTYTYQYQLS